MRIASLVVAGLLASSLAVPAHAAPTLNAAPQIDSVSPALGAPGDEIEITGRGFDDGGQAPVVTFLSLYAGQVTAFTDSALTVIVPAVPNPPDGPIELRVTTSAGFDVAPFRFYAPTPGELSAPTVLTGKALKGKVRLRWGAPQTGSGAVTEYQWRVQQKGKAWSPWRKVAKGPSARQQVVKRIRPKQVYIFEVRAMAGTTAGPSATTQVRGK